MGLTVAFIVVFGVAAVVPAAWSVVGLVRGNRTFWPGVVGTAWAILLMALTFVGMGVNWGGCDSGSDSSEGAITCAVGDVESMCRPDVWAVTCGRSAPGCPAIAAGAFCPAGNSASFDYCEPIQLTGAKQPWATWSDLSFVAAGLWLLWSFQFFGGRGTRTGGPTTSTLVNPMVTIGALSVVYGLIVVFMGPASMWFHASMRDWGGWFDSVSVVAWLVFNAVYVAYALFFAMWGRGRGPERSIAVLVAWAVLVVVFGIVAAAEPGARLWAYVISGALWGIAEVVYVFLAAFCSGARHRRTWWLFVLNLGLLAATMTIWVFFNPGVIGPGACRERAGFPGHALFHILASFSTILTFASFASERSVSR